MMRTILAGICIVCIASSFVLWFMISAEDRSRIRIAPSWKQRKLFTSAGDRHRYVAALVVVELGSALGLIHWLL